MLIKAVDNTLHLTFSKVNVCSNASWNRMRKVNGYLKRIGKGNGNEKEKRNENKSSKDRV